MRWDSFNVSKIFFENQLKEPIYVQIFWLYVCPWHFHAKITRTIGESFGIMTHKPSIYDINYFF